jgi:predicted Zn-dependent protease
MKSANEVRIFFNLLALSLLLIFLSCATNPVTGKSELMLVSEDKELQIGRDSAPSLMWEFNGQYRDNALHSYLDKIIKNLWQNSERPHLPVKFYIQNTSVPNAFALPGYVAVTRGLLSDFENEAQFAAVMGHEIGHVMARHTAQRLSRVTLQQLGLAIGSAALQGKGGGNALLNLGAVGSSLLLLKYDRGQELQADKLSVTYMSRLGYDPYEAVSAHKTLERSVSNFIKRQGGTRREDNYISNLLSTHPRKEVRIGEIQAMIRQLPPYRLKGNGKFTTIFQNATQKLKNTNKVYFVYDKAKSFYDKKNFSSAEETIRKAIKQNGSQATFYGLLGFIKLQQKKYADAEKAHNKALSLDPGYQPSIFGAGLVNFYKGKYGQAISELKRSIKLYPNHAPSHFGLGKSYFYLKEYRKAIPYLRNYMSVAPKDPEVHGLLGMCSGQP